MSATMEYDQLDPGTPSAGVRFDEPAGWILVARIRGELDIATVPPLRAALERRLSSSRPCRLILDLTSVTLLSSAALGLLLELHRGARTHDRHLILIGTCHRAVRRPLWMTGLVALFDTQPTIEHALIGSALSRATPAHVPALRPAATLRPPERPYPQES